MIHSHTLPLILVLLAASVIIVPFFKRLGLGSVLGYLAAGALLGPSCLRVFTDSKTLMSFAELGVVMLLFIIGLELRPARLWEMRKSIFGLGGFQILITTCVFVPLLIWNGFSLEVGFVAAFALALSSTPFTLQLLEEKRQLNTSHGKNAFAILLCQDLAVIPVLVVLPVILAIQPDNGKEINLVQICLALAGLVIAGRVVLPRVFRLVAASHLREVFTAASLLLVLGLATWMEHAGLSMALGTFLSGVMLSDSEYRHELEANLEPFKGLLMGIFFMGIGMTVDLAFFLTEPVHMLTRVLGYMTLKAFTI